MQTATEPNPLHEVKQIRTTIDPKFVNQSLATGWVLLNIFENTYTLGWSDEGEPPETDWERQQAEWFRSDPLR